jgi:hypothetical protein
MTAEEKMKLRRLGAEIKTFLRLAGTNLTTERDRRVLARLLRMADRYAMGVDIMAKEPSE